jgi:hypothetical protein
VSAAAGIRQTKAAMKDCGGCTLCCKVIGIKELNKPQGVWCTHCLAGVGCKIYESKPEECGTFVCGWLCEPALGEEWKPSRSKIVLTTELGGRRIVAHMDPQRPDAWQREPYRAALKEWARNGQRSGGEVVISINGQRTPLKPD